MLNNIYDAFGADACPKPVALGFTGAPVMTRHRDGMALIAPAPAVGQGTRVSAAGDQPNAGDDAAWGPPIG